MSATVVKQQAATRLSRLELRRRWQQMLHDPMLVDIPGKIELNEKSTIELSPPNTPHSIFQAFVASELRRLRPDGTPMTECAIETDADAHRKGPYRDELARDRARASAALKPRDAARLWSNSSNARSIVRRMTVV